AGEAGRDLARGGRVARHRSRAARADQREHASGPGARARRAGAAMTDGRGARAVLAVALGAGVLAVAVPFFASTTFTGDDHLFLAFARYAPNPLRAFVNDQHGGEFYRPFPMTVWWLLGRWGHGSALPFATLAL